MIRLKHLKAGDLIQIDYYAENSGWAVSSYAGRFKTIIHCNSDHSACMPDKTIVTYFGEIKIPNAKTGKMFFGCYYNEQIIYISQYLMKTFKKIKC